MFLISNFEAEAAYLLFLIMTSMFPNKLLKVSANKGKYIEKRKVPRETRARYRSIAMNIAP